MAAGARVRKLDTMMDVRLSTLQRWRHQFFGYGDGLDRRKGVHRLASHRLTDEERQRILLTCNQPEIPALPPGQILPALVVVACISGSE